MVAEVARGSLGELPRGALADRCRGFGHHQLTALGDGMLLDLDPASGEYCVLLLSRDALSSRPPLAPVATGNLYRAPCARLVRRLFAGGGVRLVLGDEDVPAGRRRRPCAGGCADHWTEAHCAEWPCSHHATCDDCLGSQLCGWCGGTNEAWRGATSRRCWATARRRGSATERGARRMATGTRRIARSVREREERQRRDVMNAD